jgi:hypothetical protein
MNRAAAAVLATAVHSGAERVAAQLLPLGALLAPFERAAQASLAALYKGDPPPEATRRLNLRTRSEADQIEGLLGDAGRKWRKLTRRKSA